MQENRVKIGVKLKIHILYTAPCGEIKEECVYCVKNNPLNPLLIILEILKQ